MKKELSNDYFISVENMLDMSKSQEIGGFALKVGSFFSEKKNKFIDKNILSRGDKEQIFSMNDGKFILEVDDGMQVSYFYSNNINDLI